MTIAIESIPSPVKAWTIPVTASAAGLALGAHSVLLGPDRYDVPAMSIPCVYSDDAHYRVALCRNGAAFAIVLVEDGALPAGYEEVIAPVRWAFKSPADTCATVRIDTTHRTLAPRPIEFRVVDVEAHGVPVLDEHGVPTFDDSDVATTYRNVSIEYGAATGLHRDERGVTRATVDGHACEIVDLADVLGCSTDDIYPRLTPLPTVHAVSPTPVLPDASPTGERAMSRRKRARVRDLRQQARTLRDAGTTYAAMTAAQRQIIGELVALDPTGEVPMAVP